MSLHDNLAQKAREKGKTASEFTKASQNHANATWVFLIIAGIVWYFFGWRWALIPIALGLITVLQSISSTMIAQRLKNE
mgnify:FL=1|jgi:uncharacterized membrane protein YgcG